VNFTRHGVRYYRRFCEPKYGGSAKARKAAITWREEQLANIAALSLLEFCEQKRSNNTSGTVGVHFLKSATQPQGIWQAKLKIAGKYVSKTFAVKKHGERHAYKLAVAACEQMLVLAENRPYFYNKVAKRFAADTARR
jgi:hypothetical protein